MCRVFHQKILQIRDDLRRGVLFGGVGVDWTMEVTEFQKRGLPHAHILVRLKGDPPVNSERIDAIVSAMMPPEVCACSFFACQLCPIRCFHH